MNEWARFFLGTPRRLLATLAGIVFLLAIVSPALVDGAVVRVMAAFSRLFEGAAVLLVIWAGYRLIFRR